MTKLWEPNDGDDPFGLLGFEPQLLDRDRPWAGSGGRTLKYLGLRISGVVRSVCEAPGERSYQPR
jgi:hypothetical protein